MSYKGFRLIGVLALITACLSCGGGTDILYNQGRKAEERKDWDTAVVDYEKARAQDPANPLYILHEQNARKNASLFHLRNGQQLLKDGKSVEAAGEFQKAVRIDPSNISAQQELEYPDGEGGGIQKGPHGGNSEGAEGPRGRDGACRGETATHFPGTSCPPSSSLPGQQKGF